MRETNWALDPEEYDTDTSEDGFGSIWDDFQGLRRFFEKAALHDRAVVFAMDQ